MVVVLVFLNFDTDKISANKQNAVRVSALAVTESHRAERVNVVVFGIKFNNLFTLSLASFSVILAVAILIFRIGSRSDICLMN